MHPPDVRLRAVPIFPLEFVEPRKDIANVLAWVFRAPALAMSFRGSTNSRGKIGTARSLPDVSNNVMPKVLLC